MIQTEQELVYVDTSLYLALLLNQRDLPKKYKTLSRYALCSSILLVIEVERNLVRMSRQNLISEFEFSLLFDEVAQISRKFALKDVSSDLCLSGQYPVVRTPKSNDLIHLRTAIWFKQNYTLKGFATLDQAQELAAKEMSLPLWSL